MPHAARQAAVQEVRNEKFMAARLELAKLGLSESVTDNLARTAFGHTEKDMEDVCRSSCA